jgi:hypothetical protein
MREYSKNSEITWKVDIRKRVGQRIADGTGLSPYLKMILAARLGSSLTLPYRHSKIL